MNKGNKIRYGTCSWISHITIKIRSSWPIEGQLCVPKLKSTLKQSKKYGMRLWMGLWLWLWLSSIHSLYTSRCLFLWKAGPFHDASLLCIGDWISLLLIVCVYFCESVLRLQTKSTPTGIRLTDRWLFTEAATARWLQEAGGRIFCTQNIVHILGCPPSQ